MWFHFGAVVKGGVIMGILSVSCGLHLCAWLFGVQLARDTLMLTLIITAHFPRGCTRAYESQMNSSRI